ncbi:MAG: hypothetical protein HKN88_01735, partial [Gammaproteobacteria bacterium]|nr:hypothetical protein [Gammaproteobacteria bacterium]
MKAFIQSYILLITVSACAICAFAAQPKLEHSEVNKLYQLEKEAMQAYRAGDYAKAFEKLSITAPQGL